MTNKKVKKSKSKKNRKSKKKMGNHLGRALPLLSKREPSGNWVTFLKSQGLERKLKKNYEKLQEKKKSKKPATPELTKVLALDCEMVADEDNMNMLARVSIVNYNLQCVFDKFVKPTAKICDYRTRFSGIREENLKEAEDYDVVREEVLKMLKDKILVGHALPNDFRVLRMKHPCILTRDTSTFPPFKDISDSRSPSLKRLARHFLNEKIQEGEHCSVQDAVTAMKLYKKFNQEWELSIHKSNKVQILD